MEALSVDPSGVQSLADIESYLANFNKEISDHNQAYMFGGSIDNAIVGSNPVYTDLNVVCPSSQFKLESSNRDRLMHENGDRDVEGHCGYDEDGSIDPYSSSKGDDLNGNGGGGDSDPHSGSANNSTYQTVTIVPSSVNPSGEVSYMLIVSQEQDDGCLDKGENPDLSVFDFKEEGAGGRGGADDDEGDGELEEDEEQEQEQTEKVFVRKEPQQRSHATPTNTVTQLMCNYCNYTSPKRFLLARHMKAHSEERPHKCSICGRAFKTIPSLQNHINTHTGVRPNKCKECESAFTTSGELIRHVRYRHTYEKPHKCTECDYASVELSKLKRHIRSHTGQSVFLWFSYMLLLCNYEHKNNTTFSNEFKVK